MAAVKDSFLDLERHRQQLEDNVQKLSKALDHWQQSKEEYDALRTELKSLSPSASRHDLTRAREEFKGELLDEKELIDIFGRNDSKKPEQIISILTNRIDYVSKNIDTLGKQLETAENKLAAATVISNPDASDEDGLPITEILEELDDDDNVISYSLRTPGNSQPQLLEALEKAGITDIPLGHPAPLPEASEIDEGPSPIEDTQSQLIPPKDTESQPPPQPTPASERTDVEPISEKKSVKFSEDTKFNEKDKQSDTAKRLEDILRKARDQQSVISEPVIPADESPDDAALREDMLRYNKDTMEFEMAPIVAELQLEEGSTGDDTDYGDYDDDDDDEEHRWANVDDDNEEPQWANDDDDDEEDQRGNDYDDDEEDQWGRSTRSLITDEYRREMLELKKRMSKHVFRNGRAAKDGGMVEGIGRISIQQKENTTPHGDAASAPVVKPSPGATIPASESKKGVRFAETIDVAEAPAPAPAPEPAPPKPSKQPEVDPLSDVMERTSDVAKPTETPSAKKPSRFRKERSNGAPATAVGAPTTFQGLPVAPSLPKDHERHAPSGPEGQTLAPSVLEHAPSAAQAREPDELDANLMQQQVAEEYHRMRNRFIHRQGGFMKEDENPIQPLDEEEGGPRRVSRFKAARLGRS
ncbi:Prefoldin subunit-domain-containing protein [Whalleya microplaca]|nr:Prefoldin subunit-domain-containing protein [Whalleya microplaca]